MILRPPTLINKQLRNSMPRDSLEKQAFLISELVWLRSAGSSRSGDNTLCLVEHQRAEGLSVQELMVAAIEPFCIHTRQSASHILKHYCKYTNGVITNFNSPR